jgi:hypothetical protein
MSSVRDSTEADPTDGRATGLADRFTPEAHLAGPGAAAHGEHETRVGHADPAWRDWYAEYMVAEQAGAELSS